MSETLRKTGQILAEIEGTDAESVDAVAEKLLGHPNTFGQKEEKKEEDDGQRNAEREEILRRLRECSRIEYNHPLSSNRKVLGKLSVNVRRFYRRMMRPVMTPIIEDQNRFNEAVVDAIEKLSRNEK